MVDRSVVLAKVAAIEQGLDRLRYARDPATSLSERDRRDIVELNLQRATQSAISLAHHVASTEGWGLPARASEVFDVLAERGILSADLADRLKRMVGFRNVLVHRYEEVDPAIVESILEHHLGDLESFAAAILEGFGLREGA
ncbi:MAG: DUF86 domain-containing protein [Holophagales bacterium]|nr:DUF86 domain-containing protein [Holophagales bacterium]